MQGLPASDDEDEDIELLTVGPAPELTSDDKLAAFLTKADRRSENNDELLTLAAEYLEVIPCLPRLAPRCATRAALALQTSDGDVDAAVEAYFRDLDEVKIAESLCTRAHTLCTLCSARTRTCAHMQNTCNPTTRARYTARSGRSRAPPRARAPARRGRVALAPQR